MTAIQNRISRELNEALTENDITPELNAIIAKAEELSKISILDPKMLLKVAVAKLEREGK